MLLLGYWDEGMSLWEQDCNDAPAGVEVSVQGVDAAVGRVNVAWRVLGDALAYVIERSAEGGSWTAIARMAPDGIGQVTFEDRAVVPGGRYGYRLRFGSAETLTAAGEVWVTVPTALALAIEPPEPNPAVGVLRVSFTVPTSEPATLAMLDISGRHVLVRSVDHQEPGRHTLQVADRGTLEPGVYFLRLRQGAVVATARVCIIR